MRLLLILPRVEPTQMIPPSTCPHENCQGRHFRFHQAVIKRLIDTVYQEVEVQRYQCLRCQRTFRVYPPGVAGAHTSWRVKGLVVLLYMLNLSHGAVSLALEAPGVCRCKSRYDAVQAAAERVPGLKQGDVAEKMRAPVLAGDMTSVKCQSCWQPLGFTVDDTSGLVAVSYTHLTLPTTPYV